MVLHLAQCNAKQGHGSIHQGVGAGLAVCVGGWTQLLLHLPRAQQCESGWAARAPLYGLSTSSREFTYAFARTQCNCCLVMRVPRRVSVHRAPLTSHSGPRARGLLRISCAPTFRLSMSP